MPGTRTSLRAHPQRAIFALAIAGSLLAGSCGANATAREDRAVRRDAIDRIAHATSGVALGVNTTDAPSLAYVQFFARLGSRKPAVVMWSQNWSEPLFYPRQLPPLYSNGLIPMINWLPQGPNGAARYPLQAIAEGSFDRYIRGSAEAAARVREPMFISFAHEMNLSDSPWGAGLGTNTPGEYIRAWRHVVSIFRAEGAENVRWVWAPNVQCEGSCPFSPFFPGEKWVDWVGLDAYNGGQSDKSHWRQFSEILGQSYDDLAALSSKPLMVGETASVEAGGSKAQWILNLGRSLITRFPRVRVLVWFDRVKEADWRINSSAASLAAFRAMVSSPPFVGSPVP
jgi:mannan endo-1,4-beta-mannosidase